MKPIYLDYNATTPTDPEVVDEMLPFFGERFGNPSSSTHMYGWDARANVERARKRLARLLKCKPGQIVFTSGATESNNTVLFGIARSLRARGKHIITTQLEHKCVLKACAALEQDGYRVTYLAPDADGLIPSERVAEAIADDTVLISVMAANNEIGTLQPIKDIGEVARREGVAFHTDAAQLVGKLPVNLAGYAIDFMSVSAHKLYGPKGVGALYAKDPGTLADCPLIHGGGQEQGLRAGTLNVPGIVGLGKAAAMAGHLLATESMRLARLKETFVEGMHSRFEGVSVNGHRTQCLPGCVSLRIAGVDAAKLMVLLKDRLALSTGSACTSEAQEPSHVLSAIGLGAADAQTSFRVGLGRYTTDDDVARALEDFEWAIERARQRPAVVAA